jgi:hypothetical protein
MLASIVCYMFLVSFSIAKSIDCALCSGYEVKLGELVSMLVYFLQLMKRLVVGGDEESGVFRISSRIGLWSDNSSFRLEICVGIGSLMRLKDIRSVPYM